jgi:hypothetical protein
VRAWTNHDGTASIFGTDLPVDRAAAADEYLTRLARAAKADGDVRTLAQLRADAYLDLLTGIAFRIQPSCDPVTAQADHQSRAAQATQHQTTQHDGAPHQATQGQATQGQATQNGAAQNGAAQNGAAQNGATQGEAAQREGALRQTAQREPAQREPAQREPAQHEPTRHERAQPGPSQHVPAQRRATQPEPTEHEARLRWTAQHQATLRQAMQRHATRHEAAQPGPARHERSQGEAAQREAAQRQATQPEPTQHDPAHGEAPGAGQRQATQPEPTQHDPAHGEAPGAGQRQATQPEPTQHDPAHGEAQHGARQRQATQHEPAQHEATQLEAAQPWPGQGVAAGHARSVAGAVGLPDGAVESYEPADPADPAAPVDPVEWQRFVPADLVDDPAEAPLGVAHLSAACSFARDSLGRPDVADPLLRSGWPPGSGPAEQLWPDARRCCGCGGVRPADRRGVVSITMTMSTLVGLCDDPAVIPGWGPVLAEIARSVALDQATTPAWQFAVTDPHGRLLHSGPIKRRPTAQDRRHAQLRDQTCRAPNCRRPAAACDTDHRKAHASGGASDHTNLDQLCRHDHRLKHEKNLTLTPIGDGAYRWRAPNGRTWDVPADPIGLLSTDDSPQ